MEQSFDDFLKEIKHVSGPRIHKIRNSVNTINGFYYYRKIKSNNKELVLKDVQYLSIIREMNLLLVDSLIKNKSFRLPSGMGLIEILKIQSKS